MKKVLFFVFVCVCFFGLYGCSDDDGPAGGKGAMYQVTLRQSGELDGFIKSLVITANGAKLVHEETGRVYEGTAVLSDTDLTSPTVTLTTQENAIEFAVSGAVVDRDDEVVSGALSWTVIVTKDGNEVGRKSLTFEDGKGISADDLNLYYK